MTRFMDTIDQLFDELVHKSWRAPLAAPHLRPQPAQAALELQLPMANAAGSDIALTTEGDQLIVTLRRRAAANSAHDADRQLQQTVMLPVGMEPTAFDVQFEPDRVRIRITLCRRSHLKERS